MLRKLLLGVGLVLPAACASDHTVRPDESEVVDDTDFHVVPAFPHVTVMTRNMYVGAPVEIIIAEPNPDSIPVRAAEAWAALLATDFPSRAKGMADEVARARPHLIGLQEVSLFRTQTPSDVIFGNPSPNAQNTAFDFLGTLLDEIALRGLDYRVVASVENFDVEVPRFDVGSSSPIPFTDVRLTDYDVILARGDVGIANAAAARYSVALSTPAGLTIARGWATVDATVRGVTYRFVSTHLEAEVEQIKAAQAQELAQILSMETKPLILVGDLNTGPGRPEEDGGQQTYDFLLDQGYADAWTLRFGRGRHGNTCCHAGDLSNRRAQMTQRIDLVLFKNMEQLFGSADRPLVLAGRVGVWQFGRRRYGIWPSDHAGVVARMAFPGW